MSDQTDQTGEQFEEQFNEEHFVDLIDINRVAYANLMPRGDFVAAGNAAADYIERFPGPIALSTRSFKRGSNETNDFRWVHLGYAHTERLVKALAERRVTQNGWPFACEYAHDSNNGTLVRYILDLHDRNDWFNEAEQGLILSIVERNPYRDQSTGEPIDLLPYCLSIYERHGIPLDGEFRCHSWKSTLLATAAKAQGTYGTLLQYFHDKGLLTHDNVLTHFRTFATQYATSDPQMWRTVLNIVHNYLGPAEINYLPQLVRCGDWPLIEQYAELYRKAGGDLRSVVAYGETFLVCACHHLIDTEYGPAVMAYLQSHFTPEEFAQTAEVSRYVGKTSPINEIVKLGNVATLRMLPWPLPNTTSRYYVACPHCYNGEPAECNWRTVDTEFLLRERYGLSICAPALPTELAEAPALWLRTLIKDPYDDEEAGGTEDQSI